MGDDEMGTAVLSLVIAEMVMGTLQRGYYPDEAALCRAERPFWWRNGRHCSCVCHCRPGVACRRHGVARCHHVAVCYHHAKGAESGAVLHNHEKCDHGSGLDFLLKTHATDGSFRVDDLVPGGVLGCARACLVVAGVETLPVPARVSQPLDFA
jgi:hypothetical protein